MVKHRWRWHLRALSSAKRSQWQLQESRGEQAQQLNKSTKRNFGTAALLGVLAVTMSVARPADVNPVTAIDVLLEPDATMLKHAAANNTRLLAVFPKGFALDAAQLGPYGTAAKKLKAWN